MERRSVGPDTFGPTAVGQARGCCLSDITVFEPDGPFQDFARVDETTVAGPGVGDMKGGLVIMLQALGALDSEGLLEDMNISVAIIGDEERGGSPRELARGDLVETARWADVALGFEGLETSTSAAVARRGVGEIQLIDPMQLGGADISRAAPYVDGALAAIGGMGAGWHSFDETADLDNIAIRTKLAAAFILRLSRGAFESR